MKRPPEVTVEQMLDDPEITVAIALTLGRFATLQEQQALLPALERIAIVAFAAGARSARGGNG